jgi:hypothetical protein
VRNPGARLRADLQPDQSSVGLRKEIGSGSRADWFQPVANGIESKAANDEAIS